MRKQRIRVLAAAALGCAALGVGIAAPAFPAVTSQSPPGSMAIAERVALQAKGAAVAVTVSVQCPPGYADFQHFVLSLTQKVGPNLASASLDTEGTMTCTGNVESYTFYLHATSKPFKKGVAAATAGFHGYSYATGLSLDMQDNVTVTIK